jgi:hypothetical protein
MKRRDFLRIGECGSILPQRSSTEGNAMRSFLRAVIVALSVLTCCNAFGQKPPAPVATPRVHSGTAGPPVNCGLPCQTPVTVSVSLFTEWNVPLQGQVAFADYVVTNKSLRNFSGTVVVTLAGQVMTDTNPHTIMLTSGTSASGSASIANAPAGTVALDARYLGPQQCSPVVVPHVGKVRCTPGPVIAEGVASGLVYPDGDHDGLADDYEALLLQTYAPLMLFSHDHDSEEQYAPIDVIDFVRGSTLVSKESDVLSISDNATLAQNPAIVLNPTGVPTAQDPIGTINANQQPLGPLLGNMVTDSLPRQIYLSPSSNAEKGADWATVMRSGNVGLYGHVVTLNVDDIANNASQAFDDPVAQQENQLLHDELAALLCERSDGACTATVFKIEYWQFFGYSHDLELPWYLRPLAGLAAGIIDHSGDWCNVQLYVNGNTAFTQPDKAILAVYHFAHGLRFGFDMQRPGIAAGVVTAAGVSSGLKAAFTEFTIKQFQGANILLNVDLPFQNGKKTQDYKNAQNNVVQLAQDPTSHLFVHPVVYVEWGGHEFWPSAAWSFKFASKHGGDSATYRYIAATPPNVGEVGMPMPGVPQAPFVTGFSGFWGYYGWENQNKPPQGPPLHAQWLWYPSPDLKVRPSQNLPPF